MEKTKTTELLSHMLERLADNEIATSDIKQMLVKLNATIQEVVQVLDIVIAEDGAYIEQRFDENMDRKTADTKYIISEYFKNNSSEAEELLEELTKQKVLFVHEVGES